MRSIVIIPAYNEQASVLAVIDSLKNAEVNCDYVVINDGSNDETGTLLAAHNAQYITLPCNLGIGACVQTGYCYACERGYDIAIQMDGDGQHDPGDLKALIGCVERGEADMAVGSRFAKGEGFQSSTLRRAGIRYLSFMMRLLTGQSIMDMTSGYRACGRALIEHFASSYPQDYPEPESLMEAALIGCRLAEVPVSMRERMGGHSSIHGLKSITYIVKVSLAMVLRSIHLKRQRRARK